MTYHLDLLTPEQDASAEYLATISMSRLCNGIAAARGEYDDDLWGGIEGDTREIAMDYYSSTATPGSKVPASRYVYYLSQLDRSAEDIR